jgi:hypothetical protein
MTIQVAVDAAVFVSTVFALVCGGRLLGRGAPPAGAGERRCVSPLVALAGVTGLVYLNQVLFTVYVLRVHGGDASFIARFLPVGWFDLATGNPVLRSLAAHFPAPALLAPSVLRVQAFLELPFVLLAFMTVLRWLDADLYRRVARSVLVPLASVSYTVVFCLAEWDLRNPYTVDDLVIRAVSAVVTPVFIAWLARRDTSRTQAVASVSALLAFISSLGALGVLVLVVYDTALLYNLGRVAERLPIALAAVGALLLARVVAARLAEPAVPGVLVPFVRRLLGHWLVLFFVPALAVRYGVMFGTPLLAAVASLLLVAAAVFHATRETLAAAGARGEGATRGRRARLVGTLAAGLGGAALAGGVAAYVISRLTPASYYEATLLPCAAVFLVTAIVACGVLDRAVAGNFDHVSR